MSRYDRYNYYGFRPYVTAAERKRKALLEAQKRRKQGKPCSPIVLAGRKIASSFWGKAWCDNLESYMDFANRLPRGRTYVRNGSVVHLEIKAGCVEALVSGSSLYKVKVGFTPAAPARWKALCGECAGGISSLVELLQGRFSDRVMTIITRKETGLFPAPAEIEMSCSCPDWAVMCKHVAAVLYGVGARLDEKPELLFLLRSVNHEELITRAAGVTDFTAKAVPGQAELSESEVSDVFGIEIDSASAPQASAASASRTARPNHPIRPGRGRASRKAPKKRGGKTTARKPKAKRSPARSARKPSAKAPLSNAGAASGTESDWPMPVVPPSPLFRPNASL